MKRFYNPIKKIKVWFHEHPNKFFLYVKTFYGLLSKIQPWISIILALIVSIPLSLITTTAISNYQTAKDSTTYREGVVGRIDRIDPYPLSPSDIPFSQLNRDISRILFNPLFTTTRDGAITGVLANTYDVQNNGTKYVVTLRSEQWSDNSIITAKDVVASFNTIKDIGPTGLYYPSIENVNISYDSNSQVSFTLATADNSFLETLNWPILPEKILVTKYSDFYKSKYAQNPITDTGWNIKDINDSGITLFNKILKRNIKFLFYNDSYELSQAINAGYIDGYYSLEKVNSTNYTSVHTFVLPREVYSLYFNLSDSSSNTFLKDTNIRKAISYAIDRNAVAYGEGKQRQSIIPDTSWAYDPTVNTYPYNITEANKILDTAGDKFSGSYRQQNGKDIEFTLSIPSIHSRQLQADELKKELAVIGIKMNIKTIQDKQFIDSELKQNIFYNSIVLTRNYEAMIYSVDTNIDPDKFSQWSSTKITDLDKGNIGLNFEGYNNSLVDVFLSQGKIQTDQTQRKTAYLKFQKVFYEDAPVVTLYNPYIFYVTSNRIKAIDFTSAVRIEDRFLNFNNWDL